MKRYLYGLGMMLGVAASSGAAGEATDPAYARWQAQAEQTRQDPALVRYYTFEEQAGLTVANRAPGGDGELTLLSNSPYGTSRERRWWVWNSPFFQTFPEWTTGRWPGKGALASGLAGTCVVRSHFSGTEDGVFTLAAWVRLHGVAERSDLFNISDGYKTGWKVVYTRAQWCPAGSIDFRLGTPAGPVVINAAPFPPQVWHQLVVQWDGTAIRAFVDGAQVGEKPCAGPYVAPPRNEDWSRDMAEMDVGGFHFGGRPGTERFDVDEVAIYKKALTAAEIKAQYEAGRPAADAAAQQAACVASLAHRQELAAISMTIPHDTLGIFRRGTAIPARLVIPARLGWQGAYTAHYLLRDLRNMTVLEETRPLAVSPTQDATAVLDLAPERCGIYFLDLWVTDPAGAVVKRLSEEYGLAITVPLPAPQDIPLSSPLAAHNISGGYPENAFVGFGVDRWIKSNETYKKPGEWNGDIFAKELEYERQSGLKVMFCLHLYAPDWAEKVPGKKWQMKDMTPWAEYVREMYRHYHDMVAYWEIENEPNAGNLNLQADEYVEFLKVAYQTLKAEDPKAVVVGLCGCPGFLNWNDKVFAAGGAPYFDVMSLHNYSDNLIRTLAQERLVERATEQLVKARGERVPVWNSETGFHPIARVAGRPMTEDVLLRTYGARVTQRPGQAAVLAADMPTLVEHATAYNQIQSIILDLAAGCQKYFMLSGVSHYHPNFNTSDGQPTEAAPALAAVASVLIPSTAVTRLPLSSSADAGAIITQTGGRRIAVLFSDESPTLSLHVDRAGTFTGMDMLGNPLKWEASAGKVLTIRLGPEPVYVFDVPADFSQLEFLKVSKAPSSLPESGLLDGELTVVNPLDRVLTGTLKPESPKGTTLTVAGQVTLQPGETKVLPFHLDGRELGRRRYELGFQLLEGTSQVGKANYSFVSEGTIRKVTELTTPGALGDARWWAALKAETCVNVEHVVHGEPILGMPWAPQWQNAQDLSFTLRLAWVNEDTVRLRIEVTDDVLLPAPADKRGLCFQYDCIELFFDGRSLAERKDVYTKGAEQMLIIPQTGTTAAPCDFWFAGKQPTISASFVGGRTATGYWVEGTLKPGPDSAFRTRAGSQFALDVLVDDRDTEGVPRKSAMALHGVFNNATDPAKWGRYQLEPAAPAATPEAPK